MDIPDNGVDTTPSVLVKYIQQQRMEMLLNNVPVDKGTMILMDQVAETALKQTKILVESNSAKAQREIASQLAKLVCEARGNPFERPGSVQGDIPECDIPEMEIAEGELSTRPSDLTIDDILPGSGDTRIL